MLPNATCPGTPRCKLPEALKFSKVAVGEKCGRTADRLVYDVDSSPTLAVEEAGEGGKKTLLLLLTALVRNSETQIEKQHETYIQQQQ
jgi:hypothetical protein